MGRRRYSYPPDGPGACRVEKRRCGGIFPTSSADPLSSCPPESKGPRAGGQLRLAHEKRDRLTQFITTWPLRNQTERVHSSHPGRQSQRGVLFINLADGTFRWACKIPHDQLANGLYTSHAGHQLIQRCLLTQPSVLVFAVSNPLTVSGSRKSAPSIPAGDILQNRRVEKEWLLM